MKIEEWNFDPKNRASSLIFASTAVVVFLGVSSFLISTPFFVNASSSSGVIDNVYKYAKGVDHTEVKINFGFFRGSNGVVVTDTSLSGYAWGENIGWVNLYPGGGGVLNNGEGVLSGYADSELGGWVNFNGVTINSSGDFLGYATTEKLGKIVFNCATNNSCAADNFKVSTDWRPASIRKDAPPDPIYTTPIDTPPPIFTSDSTPKKENPTPIPKDGDDKPLPIGDTSQYQSGGDVVKENITKTEGGSVTTIRLSDGSNPNQNTNTNPNVSTSIVKNIPKDNFLDTKIVTSVVKTTEDVTGFIQTTTKEIKKNADMISNTPAVDISTKTVTTVGIAGGGTALVSSLTTSLLSFSEFFLTFLRLWSLLLSALGLRKRPKPWGVVYDSVTKQPLDPVYVMLQDKNGKEVASSITDMDGRFGFLVPPGIYRMIAKKTNYIAPSLHLHGEERDELYDNLYFGEEIELGTDKTLIRNIPMDPQGFNWNEFEKRDKKLLKFSSPKTRIFARISNVLFYLGFILTLLLLVINKFNYFNLAIIFVYVVLFIIRRMNVKPKSNGTIIEKRTGFPLSFAIVRVFSKGSKKEIFHRVADKYGNYYCLLKKGEYYITIEKKNSDESYSNVFTSDVFFIKKGILNEDFKV